MRHLLSQTVIALALMITAVVVSTNALATREIEWKQLRPKLPPLKDPLANFTQDQRFDVETIDWARKLKPADKGLIENQQGIEDAKVYERQFAKAGYNVDELLKKYRGWIKAVAKRQERVNQKLNGTTIRMAGYLLPLEFSDQGVTDFLLVPYVGACIHVPPPPPNQIIFVRLAKKFRIADLFTAVWLEGKLQTRASSKKLTFVDGSADISIGYHINGGKAEIYRE
ncbi:MAG: DUF3299 domain-containing protein [Pseudomonadota bacterium]